MAKIGILGGTFDPPHSAHLEIARHAMIERGYDRVVFLPSGTPPHKIAVSSNSDRYNMLVLAQGNIPNLEISDLEFIRNDKTGYTIDIIPALIEKYGEDIEFIIGGDSMIDLHKWYKPHELLRSIKLVVALRDGDEESVNRAIAAYDNVEKKGIAVLDYHPQSLSSTRIRLLIELGLDTEDAVDPKVMDYITNNKLYNSYVGIRERLKASISQPRYNHSIECTLKAVKLMNYAGVRDIDKVIKAALLHDCAKGIEHPAYDSILDDAKGTPVAHAFAGARVAETDYNITDKEVLSAIYYHTTAYGNMSQLDKLIYLADMIEQTRTFSGVEELRRLAMQDFDAAFVAAVKLTVKHLLAEHKKIYPLTTHAYNRYCSRG